MSIFGSIMDKIFHRAGAPAQTQAAGARVAESQAQSAGAGAASSAPPGSAQAGGSVDVEAVLSELATHAGQDLNWRTSIVDLMKLLGLDSSLSARKQLAAELHYPGDTNDSASMNMWLQKQVMAKLAENGGKVPDSLRH
jgi:hypothetical protein